MISVRYPRAPPVSIAWRNRRRPSARPTRLRDALASLAPDETAGVAAAWTQTDEFNGQWSAADATQAISQLVSLGHAAAIADDQIYCWMSV
jgi:hypothetical protein